MTEAVKIAEALRGYGGWSTTGVLIVFGLLGYWKVLPAVLTAFTTFIEALANRQSKIEERMGAMLSEAEERFGRNIAAAEQRARDAEERHSECMAGHHEMTLEIGELSQKVIRQGEIIVLQDQTITGLKRQIEQLSRSAATLAGQPVPASIGAALQQTYGLPGTGE